MDHISRLIRQSKLSLFIALLIDNLILVGGWWLLNHILKLSAPELIIFLTVLALAETALFATALGSFLMQPIKAIWQVIVHLSPSEHGVAAPQPASLKFGRELVTNLSAQVYQLATIADRAQPATTAAAPAVVNKSFVANNLPLPLFVLDETETILFANEAAAKYIGQPTTELKGKNIYMVLDMAFPSESTLDQWLKKAKEQNATASMSWERVRLSVLDNHPTRLFDLAAYYNKGNPNHYETMLVLFDHTQEYSQDEQAVSFIALSVHELRTPLTLLRGYIEAFEDEMGGKLSPELNDFMQKMSATAQQLTAFVSNILNVARIDDDQLQLELREEDWSETLKSAIDGINLRAKVRGIELECTIAPDLPKVGIDHLSIREVVSNIIDNAIKYSGDSKLIRIDAHMTPDGLVETTVQDFGMGIPESVIPNLFTKFYRDHRNRAQIGGTGLGLYLSKAIVTAHGGNIWVRSKEGGGSTFGFTILPYTRLAEEQKNSDNKDIVRSPHGWIKNHSLYRR